MKKFKPTLYLFTVFGWLEIARDKDIRNLEKIIFEQGFEFDYEDEAGYHYTGDGRIWEIEAVIVMMEGVDLSAGKI